MLQSGLLIEYRINKLKIQNIMKQHHNPEDEEARRRAEMKYSGVAINVAEKCRVNQTLEKERTKVLNNNPRNEDM